MTQSMQTQVTIDDITRSMEEILKKYNIKKADKEKIIDNVSGLGSVIKALEEYEFFVFQAIKKINGPSNEAQVRELVSKLYQKKAEDTLKTFGNDGAARLFNTLKEAEKEEKDMGKSSYIPINERV